MSGESCHPTYQYGTSAWIIKIQNNNRATTGDNVVPGDAKYQCSNLSELCGCIDDIRHINKTFSTYNVLEGSAELGCDGFEAYKVAIRYAYAPSTKLSHYDWSSALHQLIKSNPLSWKFFHVKGCQDNSDKYNNIDEWGWINIWEDRLAKYWLWSQIHAGATHQPHKDISGAIQPTTMEYHNIIYYNTSHLDKTIKKTTSKHRRLKYWSSHNRDISDVLTVMSVFQRAANNLTIWQQRCL